MFSVFLTISGDKSDIKMEFEVDACYELVMQLVDEAGKVNLT